MFGITAATVGTTVTNTGRDRNAFSQPHKFAEYAEKSQDKRGEWQVAQHNSVALREIFSVSARVLAAHEVRLFLTMLQAFDKKFGSARVTGIGPEQYHDFVQEFVTHEKAQATHEERLKACSWAFSHVLAPKKGEAMKPAPSLENDPHLRNLFGGHQGLDGMVGKRAVRNSLTGLKEDKAKDKHKDKQDKSADGKAKNPRNMWKQAASGALGGDAITPSGSCVDMPPLHKLGSNISMEFQHSVSQSDNPSSFLGSMAGSMALHHPSVPEADRQSTEEENSDDVPRTVAEKRKSRTSLSQPERQNRSSRKLSQQEIVEAFRPTNKVIKTRSRHREDSGFGTSTQDSAGSHQSILEEMNTVTPMPPKEPPPAMSVLEDVPSFNEASKTSLSIPNTFQVKSTFASVEEDLSMDSPMTSQAMLAGAPRDDAHDRKVSPPMSRERSGQFLSSPDAEVAGNATPDENGGIDHGSVVSLNVMPPDEESAKDVSTRLHGIVPSTLASSSTGSTESIQVSRGSLLQSTESYAQLVSSIVTCLGPDNDGVKSTFSSPVTQPKAMPLRAIKTGSLLSLDEEAQEARLAARSKEESRVASRRTSTQAKRTPKGRRTSNLSVSSTSNRTSVSMARKQSHRNAKLGVDVSEPSTKRSSFVEPIRDVLVEKSTRISHTTDVVEAENFSDDDESATDEDDDWGYDSDETEEESTISEESEFSSDASEEERFLHNQKKGASARNKRASRIDEKWKMITKGGTTAFEDVLEEDTMVFSHPSNNLIMHPDSTFRISWDMVVLAFILIDSFTMSFSIGFDVVFPDALVWMISFIFLIDLFLSLFTGYFVDGVLVMRQKMIVLRYVFSPSRSVIDILACFPWGIVFRRSDGGQPTQTVFINTLVIFCRLMRLLRIFKLRVLLKRFEERFRSDAAVLGLVLGKTLVFFGLLCHWCACLWAFIGSPNKIDYGRGPSFQILVDCERGGPCESGIEGSPWMRRYAVDTMPFQTQYIMALHFAAAVITGNDLSIQPGYWLERQFVSVMMICSFFVCTWMVSQIILVMQKLRRLESDFSDQMRVVKDYMTRRRCPSELQSKIKRYLEYQYENRKARNDNPEFITILSPWLRLELTEHLHRGVVVTHPFFMGLPNKVVKHICGFAQTIFFAPHDVVMQKGQRASSMCFIVHGKLCVLGVQSKQESSTGIRSNAMLNAPSWIGDMCLFTEMKRTKTVLSVTHSELLTIHKADIMLLVNEFPKILASYRNFKKKIEEGDLVTTGIQCEYCKGFGHAVGSCPKMQMPMRTPLKSSDSTYSHQRWEPRTTNGSMRGVRDARVQPVTVQVNSISSESRQEPRVSLDDEHLEKQGSRRSSRMSAAAVFDTASGAINAFRQFMRRPSQSSSPIQNEDSTEKQTVQPT